MQTVKRVFRVCLGGFAGAVVGAMAVAVPGLLDSGEGVAVALFGVCAGSWMGAMLAASSGEA